MPHTYIIGYQVIQTSVSLDLLIQFYICYEEPFLIVVVVTCRQNGYHVRDSYHVRTLIAITCIREIITCEREVITCACKRYYMRT